MKLGVTTKGSLSLLILVSLFGKFNLAWPQTQTDMTSVSCQKSKKAEEELNRIFRQILAARVSEPNFNKAFQEAQRTWLAFRDAHIRSIYPEPSARSEFGSIYTMCACDLQAELTTQRIKQLRGIWIDGTVEGDVCKGSGVVKPALPSNQTRKK